jgi:hypothetical protein
LSACIRLVLRNHPDFAFIFWRTLSYDDVAA